MMLRNYVEECLNIIADALGPIVVEKIPEIDSDDIRALFKAIAHEHWNVFRDIVGRNNRSRIYILLDIAHIISHKKKDTGLDSRQISEMFNSSVFLLKSVSEKEALAKVKSLEQKFNLEMSPKSQNASTPTTNVAKYKRHKRLYPRRPQGPKKFCLPEFYPCELDERPKIMANYLVELAKGKIIDPEKTDRTIYSEISKKVKLPAFSKKLFEYLGEISWVTYYNKGVFLSVLVIGKNSDIPGDGFFELVRAFCKASRSKSDDEIFKTEFERARKAAQDEDLDLILKGKTMFLPYDMGNIGDLLKHGVMTEFIRWWKGINPNKKKFVFLDPFCGYPLEECANPSVIKRLNELRDKHEGKFEILNVQSDFDKRIYHGSTYVALHQIRSCGLSPDVFISDKDDMRIKMLMEFNDNDNIKKIKCESFSPSCGYSILDSIIEKKPFADMVLIDPFHDIDKIIKIIPDISQASKKTTVVLFVLIEESKESDKWEDICDKLNKNSIILTCPPLKGTNICGESKYKVGVILTSHLLNDAKADILRKKMEYYASALSNVVKEKITCK